MNGSQGSVSQESGSQTNLNSRWWVCPCGHRHLQSCVLCGHDRDIGYVGADWITGRIGLVQAE